MSSISISVHLCVYEPRTGGTCYHLINLYNLNKTWQDYTLGLDEDIGTKIKSVTSLSWRHQTPT